METDHSGRFSCRFCKCSFSQVQYLYNHVQQVHTARPSTKNSRTCPICGIVFGIGGKNESYKTHLRHIHGQRDEGQIFTFRCFNDFFLWKTELEKRTSCKYALQSAPKVLPTNEKIHVYQCDQTSAKKKKFNVSNISSSKCPAMICATENMKNMEIKVDYWNTHVGHSVQVEQDELNAAINSVQEDSHVQVMEMLNNIGQGVDTGAEVFVTETVDASMPSTSSSRNSSMNMFNAKRGKSTKVNLHPTSPIVPNFSFKKDPSKKKESSIYSLASVACGKVSANKVNINKSASAQFQDLVKNIAKKNSGTVITTKTTVPADCSFRRKEADPDKTNDSFNSDFPSNDADTDFDSSKETGTINSHPSSIGGRFIAINPMPLNKPSSTESNEISSIGALMGKSVSDKENVSLVSNKNNNSLNTTTSRSLLKSNTNNPENSISTKTGIVDQNAKSLGIINADTPQIILTSLSVPQQNLGSLIGGKKPEPNLFAAIDQKVNSRSVVSPMTQTYLSIDNKLIPIVNTPGTALNPNLGSGIVLSSALPQFSGGQIAPISLPNLTPSFPGSFPGGLFSSNKPLLAGAKEKSTSSQAQSVSSLSTSFPNAPVVLLPYPNSLPVSSLLQSRPPTSLTSSPMVLQTVRPMTSLSTNSLVTNSLGNLGPTSLPKTVPAAIGKFGNSSSATVKSSEKSALSNIGEKLSTASTNTLKVQKVSLPSTSSTQSVTSGTNVVADAKSVSSQSGSGNPATLSSTTASLTPINKSTNSKTVSSKPSSVKPAVFNSKSAPNVNISNIFVSKNHKPGTFVFESSGEIFMLEPLDEDLVIKNNTTPVTSTPLKNKEISKTDSTPTNALSTAKRKLSSDDGSDVKYKKFKEVLSSKEGVSAVYDASTKSAYIVNEDENMFSDSSDENSNSCASGGSNHSYRDSDNKSEPENVASSTKTTNETSISKTYEKVQNNTSLPEIKSKTKHSPFTNLFPTKTSSSLLTVKTVPSLAMQPSKPMTSFISSTRTQASSLTLSSSSPNCITSIQNTEVSAEQTTSKIKNKSDSTCNAEPKERTGSELEKEPEVKRGVTIKSVVQEKRCITDSDIEIMKKVKFYKLEMQYYSCQAECKKLKIELAKVLSKNKELLQIIEDQKKNKNTAEENIDIKDASTKESVMENKDTKITDSVATTDDNSKEGENTKDQKGSEICLPGDDFLKQSGDDGSIIDTALSELDHIISKKVINVAEENSNISETASISDTLISPNTDNKEMTDVVDKISDDSKERNISTPDTVVVTDKNIAPNEEFIHESDKNCQAKNASILEPSTIDMTPSDSSDNDIAKDVAFSDASLDLNTDDDNSNQEVMDISEESSDGGKEENVKENISLANLNKLDESKKNAILNISEKESSQASDSEMVSKHNENAKADVYTMVRTSVLRNLYLDIEDLCREKRKLLEDVEHLKKSQPEFVPSTQK